MLAPQSAQPFPQYKPCTIRHIYQTLFAVHTFNFLIIDTIYLTLHYFHEAFFSARSLLLLVSVSAGPALLLLAIHVL